ncbi:hypothetical protein BDV28DRAFT_146387 [Aspergillus coremiiformis]|uniref:Thiaminase-2/PQQC domain-containing protein n=1 Tax=Aspergillus coremiiformis TaxID=138285 RepID=A0A5N6ZDE7_9EURO|nr:hypothetical protein BDV28DRAFT_146387 [Aspergillus coremiiformis]
MSTNEKETSFTAHLINLTRKTSDSNPIHPFLHAAGKGLIPKRTLSRWLSQDRLYAQAYVRFIGLLLAKCHLPIHPTGDDCLQSRTVAILIDALVNIQRELRFFEEVAEEYGLDLTVVPTGEEAFGPNPITLAYMDLFMSAGSPGASLWEGLVVLWATEVSYLQAWEVVRRVMSEAGEMEEDWDGGALRNRFIPNWTSTEFREFVDEIAVVVDTMHSRMAKDGDEKVQLEGRCERWWRQVKGLEERFWPDVEER